MSYTFGRWIPCGVQRADHRERGARRLGSPVFLAPAPQGAVDAFYRTNTAQWFSVRLRADGLYRNTSVVTPPGQRVGTISVAAAGAHEAAAWTVRRPRAHVQVARPR